MRRVWTFGLLAGALVCMVSACSEEAKQSQPNSGFQGKELNSMPAPGIAGGAEEQGKGKAKVKAVGAAPPKSD